MTAVATRGTSNGNDRGSVHTRRRRRAWIMESWASDVPGLVRCYRCGGLLFNPDNHDPSTVQVLLKVDGKATTARPLTIDRIKPGIHGGTYRRDNIRPCCGGCNSETGGRTRAKK